MITTETKAADSTLLVDLERLDESVAGDPALKREIVDLYFKQAGEIMPRLGIAIETGNVQEVNHLSHKLAGSSLSCGMSAVVPLLRQLEHGAKAGHLDGAPDAFAKTSVQMEAMQRFIRDHLQQNPN